MSAGVLRTVLRAHEILTLCRISARIRELQASFDYILIDAPPVGNDSITAQWAALADGFVLGVEPNFTSRQAARQAKVIIETAGGLCWAQFGCAGLLMTIFEIETGFQLDPCRWPATGELMVQISFDLRFAQPRGLN